MSTTSHPGSRVVRGFRFSECRTTADKQQCRDFSFKIMLTDRYGLRDPQFIDPDLLDVERYTYVAARDPESDALLATLRVDREYDVGRFPGLNTEIYDLWRAGRLAEASVYPHAGASLRQRFELFMGLFAMALAWCRVFGLEAMYAQVRAQDIHVYAALGFEVAGATFSAVGWNYCWCPVLVRACRRPAPARQEVRSPHDEERKEPSRAAPMGQEPINAPLLRGSLTGDERERPTGGSLFSGFPDIVERLAQGFEVCFRGESDCSP